MPNASDDASQSTGYPCCLLNYKYSGFPASVGRQQAAAVTANPYDGKLKPNTATLCSPWLSYATYLN